MFKECVDGYIQNSRNDIKVNEGDYINEADGLLYCGICHTKKQTEIELFGEVHKPFCVCKCEAEKIERENAERKRRELESDYRVQKSVVDSKYKLLSWLNARNYSISPMLASERIKLMREVCFSEDDLSGWTFANADSESEKAIIAARNYVDKFDTFKEQGKGIVFYGDVGTGKSFAAACIANALIDRGILVHMTNFARIANTVQGLFEGRQEYYDSFNRFPLLILDDLAAERKTEYMQEIVFQIIDARIRSGRPLIVTTNLTSEELKRPSEIAYKRTFSRLLEMCHPVKVEGADKRKLKLKSNFEAMNNLLGI